MTFPNPQARAVAERVLTDVVTLAEQTGAWDEDADELVTTITPVWTGPASFGPTTGYAVIHRTVRLPADAPAAIGQHVYPGTSVAGEPAGVIDGTDPPGALLRVSIVRDNSRTALP